MASSHTPRPPRQCRRALPGFGREPARHGPAGYAEDRLRRRTEPAGRLDERGIECRGDIEPVILDAHKSHVSATPHRNVNRMRAIELRDR